MHKKLLFYEQAEKAILNAKSTGHMLAIFSLSFSSKAENGVIESDGRAIVERCISNMLNEHDVVVHTGKDECLILVRNLKDMCLVKNVAGKVMTLFERWPYQPAGRVSAKVGCAVYPMDGEGAEVLIEMPT